MSSGIEKLKEMVSSIQAISSNDYIGEVDKVCVELLDLSTDMRKAYLDTGHELCADAQTTLLELARHLRAVGKAISDTLESSVIASAIAFRDLETSPIKDGCNDHPIYNRSVRDYVWGLTNGVCVYCGTRLTRDNADKSRSNWFCIEHVVPTSAGGPNHIKNYVPSCLSCNSSKHSSHVIEFIDARMRGGSADA